MVWGLAGERHCSGDPDLSVVVSYIRPRQTLLGMPLLPALGSLKDPKFSGGTASQSAGLPTRETITAGYCTLHPIPPPCIGLKALPAFTRVGVKLLPGSLNLFLSG